MQGRGEIPLPELPFPLLWREVKGIIREKRGRRGEVSSHSMSSFISTTIARKGLVAERRKRGKIKEEPSALSRYNPLRKRGKACLPFSLPTEPDPHR